MIGDILQPTHLLFILVIALLVLGPKRLPEVGRALGRGLRDFRNALNTDDLHEQMISTTSTETMTPTPTYEEPTAPTETPLDTEPTAQTETPLGHEPVAAEPVAAEPPSVEPPSAEPPTEVLSDPAVPTAPHESASPAPKTDPVS